MNDIIHNFQFIRPQWLWALAILLLFYVLKLKFGKDQNVWQQLIPAHLYQKMIVSKGLHSSNKFVHAAMLALMLGIIAISGPTWEKLPQAVYQTQAGKVILMDMSMSMRATDLSPNRLTRARFKAIDLINEVKEGETGLIAYAGDAFVVSPLTDDVNNLKTLIPVLAPEIMPTPGSVALNGLHQASELLQNAGYQQGQIYWITDGIRQDEIKEVRNFISKSAFDVSALLIGTEVGAPIAMTDGQLLKDYTGNIVVPSINTRYMEQAMSGTKGIYHLFASDNSDIEAIKRKVEFAQQQQSKEVENTSGDSYKDMGPFLVLLLLPIAAYSFRKGVLSIALVSSLYLVVGAGAKPAYAQQAQANDIGSNSPTITTANPDSSPESLLDKVFKNADQRGKIAFDNQDFDTAKALFEDDEWRAASAYKSGDFEQAASMYADLAKNKQANVADNLYNQGNALAKQGKLEEAINAYEQALEVAQDHEQAAANKKLVEDLLQQQQKQDGQDAQQNPNQDSSQSNEDQQQQNESQNSDSQQSEEQSDEQSGESQEGDSQQQDGQSQDDSQENTEQNQSQQGDSQSEQDDALKQAAQEQEQTKGEPDSEEARDQESGQAQAPETDENEVSEQEQQAAISNQVNMDDLSPEQKEELQRMQMILNKIPDDPAFLLKRKMQLEAYKRKNNPPPPEQENW